MSVQALGWVLDHSPTQGTDRLVLVSIANHAGQSPVDGAWEAWPGVALLQREAGLSRTRTVQDALARLEAAGHIERIINGAPDERIRKDRRSNLYRVVLDHGVTCGDTRCRWCGVTPDVTRGDASRHDGVTPDDATGCRRASPEPSLEPSLEPEVQSSVAGARLKAAVRLPEKFFLTPEMMMWAAEHVPDIDVGFETAQFCDYWRSAGGSSAVKRDWTAAWRVWMRKATPRRTPGAVAPGVMSKYQQSRANIAAWAKAQTAVEQGAIGR